jgi:iron(III) transport system permease protein
MAVWRVLIGLSLGLLGLPVLAVLASWLWLDAQMLAVWRDLAETVLLPYSVATAALAVGVVAGVLLLGGGAALLIASFDFPLRGLLGWALVLPMALPAYVTAYAYTDWLQYSGPVQTALREALGWQGAVLPEIRSLPGAIGVFVLALYPYVYVLGRGALAERSVLLLEAAQTLGAGLRQRLWRVALPLARPALLAGAALALMETLADYGVVSYFGVPTYTAGVYKAWLSWDQPAAAAQLATLLLLVVTGVWLAERRAQSRLRFAQVKGARRVPTPRVPLSGWAAAAACVACALPVLLGFALPVLGMLLRLLQTPDEVGVPWPRFVQWTWNSLRLGLITALLAVAAALWLGFEQRQRPTGWATWLGQGLGLGYAIPGAVVVVGLLAPVLALQAVWPANPLAAIITGTSVGLVWAYLVRFVAVAMQSVQSGYTQLPAALDDSARTLGRSGWRLWRDVHLPLLRRPMAAAGLLVAVDVMKELPATLVLRPFNSDTLAVVTYQLARDERLGEAALPALMLVAIGLLPIVWLSRRLNDTN